MLLITSKNLLVCLSDPLSGFHELCGLVAVLWEANLDDLSIITAHQQTSILFLTRLRKNFCPDQFNSTRFSSIKMGCVDLVDCSKLLNVHVVNFVCHKKPHVSISSDNCARIVASWFFTKMSFKQCTVDSVASKERSEN